MPRLYLTKDFLDKLGTIIIKKLIKNFPEGFTSEDFHRAALRSHVPVTKVVALTRAVIKSAQATGLIVKTDRYMKTKRHNSLLPIWIEAKDEPIRLVVPEGKEVVAIEDDGKSEPILVDKAKESQSDAAKDI